MCEGGSASALSPSSLHGFLDQLTEAIQEIYDTPKKAQKTTTTADDTVTSEESSLPRSIRANQLPYFHRTWRKEPFDKRSVGIEKLHLVDGTVTLA